MFGVETSAELERLVTIGAAEPFASWDAVLKVWPHAVATRVATIVKRKADGSSKTRIINDML
eukprot:3637690-Amphidinium_carterae.1